MFSHVHVGVSDFEQAFGFYSAVLETLGLELKFHDRDRAWAGWKSPGQDRPLFLIGRPFNGVAHDCGNGQMTALLASSRQLVDRCHETALRAGGSDDGAPGLRPQYHEHYYGAYFRDLDGNKLCICCHDG